MIEEGFIHVTEEDKKLLDQQEVVKEFVSSDLSKEVLDQSFLETPEFTEELYLIMLRNYNYEED